MAQMRNPAGQGGASDGSVHATRLNTSEDTHSTTTNQVLCGSLTGSCTEGRREFRPAAMRSAKARVNLVALEIGEIGAARTRKSMEART
jgi:hypothetical protein